MSSIAADSSSYFACLQRRVDELEEELGNMKSFRRRKTSASSDRDSSPEMHERNARSRTYDSSRSGYSRNRGGGGGRREEIEDNYSNSRENISCSEDDDDNKYNVRKKQIVKNGRSLNENDNGNENNSNNHNRSNNNGNNNHNRGNINMSKNNRDNNNRNMPNMIDKENIEETLAMQTMSLIHGQLTAMKQQLLAISDAPPPPLASSSASSSDAYPSLDMSLSVSQINGSRVSKGKFGIVKLNFVTSSSSSSSEDARIIVSCL